MASIAVKATKLTLVFINLLFVAVGICGMAMGTWVLLYRERVRPLVMMDVATNDLGLLQKAAALLITSGLVLFFLGFVGCCAVHRKQRCLHVLYIGLVVLCCVLTISACAVAFVFRDQVEDDLLSHLQTKLKTEYQGFSTSTIDFSQALDYTQVKFQCCGIQSEEDFQHAVNWTVRNSSKVPLSCCRQNDRDAFLDDNFYTIADTRCPQFPNSTNSFVETPCYGTLKAWLEEEAYMLGGVAIAAILLQILAVLVMLALMCLGPKQNNMLYRDHL
ncbi:tetraspanin-18B-like [Babylonia areolata]|uniref:tetraspanin-18B-like n=1 Tax=Babylonia areolata TaxID=304850 RepID=UPI003FD09FAA